MTTQPVLTGDARSDGPEPRHPAGAGRMNEHEPCYHCYLHFAADRVRSRQRCGKVMPVAREFCARRVGHTDSCRTRQCMDDDALSRKAKRMGLEHVRRSFYNRVVA